MNNRVSSLFKRRALWGTAGVAALSTALVVQHGADDSGVSAEDITPQAVREAAAEVDVSRWTTGHWLLDFVEPEDGEGGSEAEVAELVAELDAEPGIDVDEAGFYSEGEHLFRVVASPAAWDRIDDRLEHEPLLEGFEPEVVYALPTNSMSALRTSSVTRDDVEGNKPPRFEPDDPMFKLQWHMEQIGAPQAWTRQRGKGAVVAVIDTGVAWKDAEGVKGLPDLAGTEFTEGESFIAGLPQGLDDHAHGSHVAGTIAQTTNNGVGVTGVAFESTIMPLKVLSKDGRGSVPGIANAIRYAADHGANVINMSLGGPLPSNVLAKAIEYAHEKGVITVCAAGNESRGRVGYPAANKFSVAVSSTNYSRELAFYSNYGKNIDVAAPGGDTRNDRNGDGHPDGVLQNTIRIQRPLENDYLWFQGTSMASPHAAGVAALIVGAGVTNPAEVERVMKETAVHPTGAKWDKKFGAGIVSAAEAVAKAETDYAMERGSLTGLLALLGLSGLGIAGLTWRRRLGASLGLAAAAGVAGGALGLLGIEPLAYGIAAASGASFGSPLLLSAALPIAAALLGLGYKPLRPVIAGLALGYAALLTHGAVVLPTLVDLPGGPVVDRLWLGANALLALWLARRVSRLDA
jgi:serine protease